MPFSLGRNSVSYDLYRAFRERRTGNTGVIERYLALSRQPPTLGARVVIYEHADLRAVSKCKHNEGLHYQTLYARTKREEAGPRGIDSAPRGKGLVMVADSPPSRAHFRGVSVHHSTLAIGGRVSSQRSAPPVNSRTGPSNCIPTTWPGREQASYSGARAAFSIRGPEFAVCRRRRRPLPRAVPSTSSRGKNNNRALITTNKTTITFWNIALKCLLVDHRHKALRIAEVRPQLLPPTQVVLATKMASYVSQMLEREVSHLAPGRGGLVVRLLASHLTEPGLIPDKVAPRFSHVRILPDYTVGRRVFSGSPVSPALSFRFYYILTSLHPHRLSRFRC
ncbi:hypothetical protein PR048_000367 [Dryococelus australis]|uniref:Uncharacterized protein n=1 Tax=Dryococelus australis TaxID=614101 RepID=A0ABQ9IGP7_9NEOP|nr:hypothetical protein PR048_000367 [Dryococelus australis]